MKQETLMKNINQLLEIMPWYVKEYFQAKLVIPYSYKTLYEYLKECRRFFELLISDHEKLGETVRYADYDTIADVHIDDLTYLPKKVKIKIKIKKPKDTLASRADNMKEKLFLNDTQSFLDYIDNEHEKKISKRAQVSFIKNK